MRLRLLAAAALAVALRARRAGYAGQLADAWRTYGWPAVGTHFAVYGTTLAGLTAAVDVGLLGGGYHEIEDVTVATYDSAYMHMERLGNRFGLIVFDEVHHLPGEMYSHAAEMCIAPNRLGLTATPERADGRHVLLDTLVGPVASERGIRELSGEYLTEYRVERRQVQGRPALVIARVDPGFINSERVAPLLVVQHAQQQPHAAPRAPCAGAVQRRHPIFISVTEINVLLHGLL